jgi:hypothetical protein
MQHPQHLLAQELIYSWLRVRLCLSCAPAEETNTRVAWFSIFSLAVCVASAAFQLMYLRKFFQRKKLL